MQIDVFNGDADGICALIQLRRAVPAESVLVTGVKRDICLLDKVYAQAGDRVAVLDISMDSNRGGLLALLNQQVEVFYADHHFAGEIPAHPGLTALIDTDANLCTSLLINRHVGETSLAWAVAGAFGDNLADSASRVAEPLNLDAARLGQLQQLGVCINYNAYGDTPEDLHIAPDDLYRRLAPYPTPFDFIADQPLMYQQLLNGYAEDMRSAANTQAEYENGRIAVFILPDEKWARRVSGVWGNELANRHPDRAHAVLSHNNRGGYQVSVRAPLTNKTGADALCRQFPEGGGRQAAAGINHLDRDRLGEFIEAFRVRYAGG